MQILIEAPQRSWRLSQVFRRSESCQSLPGWSRPTGGRSRAGISLLEVLIAIFVILVGLLGVVAMIPLGHRSMVQAARADRTAACGRAGLREVHVRGMLDSSTWLHGRDTLPAVVEADTTTGLPVLDNRVSFCIDPLYIARNCQLTGGYVVAANVYKFPYTATDSTTPYEPFFDTSTGEQCWMPRVTLQAWSVAGLDPAVHAALFDRVFTWRDDMLFPVPDDRENRPQALLDVTDFPQFEGKCSWMATVVPLPGLADLTSATTPSHPTAFPAFNAANKRLFEVSVVVFYNTTSRDYSSPATTDPDKPAERTAVATLLSNGLGGGDVQLKVAAATSSSYLDVKQGDWLMLCGRQAQSGVYIRNVHKWYRIAAVDDAVAPDLADSSRPWSRLVTLAGPDWDPAWCLDLDGDGVIDDAQAVLVENVSGVYTEVMELD